MPRLQRSGRVSTVSQVTAAQIHSAVEAGENDFKIDGRGVGMVRSKKCSGTSLLQTPLAC